MLNLKKIRSRILSVYDRLLTCAAGIRGYTLVPTDTMDTLTVRMAAVESVVKGNALPKYTLRDAMDTLREIRGEPVS